MELQAEYLVSKEKISIKANSVVLFVLFCFAKEPFFSESIVFLWKVLTLH